MRVIKAIYLQFVLLVMFLFSITVFKPEVTGYVVAQTDYGSISLFNIGLGIATLIAVICVGILTFREPIFDGQTFNDEESDIGDYRRIRDYVREVKMKGYKDHEIRAALQDYGWEGEMVEHALENSERI